MVVKVYISGISGNKEVKKRQQRVLMILESKNVQYETIDITEPGKEMEKEFMQSNGKARDSKYPLPPQIFNEDDYCGDYDDFDLANEIDDLEKFLKMSPPASSAEDSTLSSKSQSQNVQENGNTSSREPSTDKDVTTAQSEGTEEMEKSKAEEKEDEVKAEASEAMEENVEENAEDNAEKKEEKPVEEEEKEE